MSDDKKYATGSGEGSGESFGFAYPDLGIIVLNPFALSCHFGSKIEEELIAVVIRRKHRQGTIQGVN